MLQLEMWYMTIHVLKSLKLINAMPIIIHFTIKQALETTNYINGIYYYLSV